jgi:filamentous hemagglutinin family protein
MKTNHFFRTAPTDQAGRPSAALMLKVLPPTLALVFSQPGWAVDPSINVGGAAGLPLNGTVTSGAATGAVAGNQLTIEQTSARAVLDWTSFNIGAGKSVVFNQPAMTSAVLNRVNGDANASQILGNLSANGTVMLMNPNGVVFGANSVVNVGSLIATTGTINQSAFEDNGHAHITGAAGSITNQGSITAGAGANGLVALVAPSVINQGSIIATAGTIALAGSTAATISLNGGLYEFAIPGGATGSTVTNAAGANLDAATIRLGVGDAANLLSGVINLEGVQLASSAIVVNGATVELKSALQAPSATGNSITVNVSGTGRIQDAVNIAKTGTPGNGAAVNVSAGNYTEQVLLNKAGMTLAGQSSAKIVVPDATQVNGISIAANNVTVSGMEIAGPVNQSYLNYAWGSNISRGIVVGNGITGFTISNNTIHDVRNGILIDGRNTGSVTGNRVDNTKSAISVQYTDSSGITVSGNTQGSQGNEWGLNLHLNGHLDGSNNIVSNSTPISVDPTLSWQQSLLGLSAANAGWSVQDQAYTSSNRTQVTVASSGTATNQGSSLAPLNTLPAGVNAVVTGGTVNLAAGTYVQPSTLVINKSLTLSGAGEAGTVIDARSVSGYGLQVSADNVTLRNFTLYGPSANTASSYGIKVSPLSAPTSRLGNFAISHVSIQGSGRAELDLNGVDGATIDNVMADGAPVGASSGVSEGAGIQLTDSANITVRNTTTRNNHWGGLALYQANRFYDQQVNNITAESSNNFTEINPVYMQDESASRNFGTLSIAGFGYAVRNAAQDEYTWLQATQQKAFDFAVNLGNTPSSYVQGWTGALTNQEFQVGIGSLAGGGTQALSINTALSHASSGATVRVGAGTYAESVVLNNLYNLYFSGSTVRGLTLNAGAAGTGISGTVTADSATGFLFNAPIRLLGDTTLATLGADINLNGDIQNAAGVARGLRLTAGYGGVRGNVHLATGGTNANPLGPFAVIANRFSLDGTLWVKSYSIDASGDVSLSSHTMRAQDAGAANILNAGGNVTGSTISLGSVQIVSAASVIANVIATDVAVQAQGAVNVVVNASKAAKLSGNSVVATVVAPVVAVAAVQEARVSGASSNLTVSAPKGSVSGSFGQVTNTGGGLVNVNGKPQGNPTLSSNAENNRVVPSGDLATQDGPRIRLAQAGNAWVSGQGGVSLSTPEAAGDAIDIGQSIELDLSPRTARDDRQKKDE